MENLFRKYEFQPVTALDNYIAALDVMRETALLLTIHGITLRHEGVSAVPSYVARGERLELALGLREVSLSHDWSPIQSSLELRRADLSPGRRIADLTWSPGENPVWRLHAPEGRRVPWLEAVGCLNSSEDRTGHYATLSYERSRLAILKMAEDFQTAGR